MMTFTPDTLHRGAKYFMDTGRAESAEKALEMLNGFGLTIEVGPEVIYSRDHQIALLTLINCARRMLLGGVHILGLTDAPLLADVIPAATLKEAIVALGGLLVETSNRAWPSALIGSVEPLPRQFPTWQVTWSGWRGGVTPSSRHRLSEEPSSGLGPAVAAACCAAEAFLYLADDHPMAGRRASGVSLWQPGANWLLPDESEPQIIYLPSRLWFIGLGNLGQAYLWLLGALDYANRMETEFVLQDFDRISESNNSTSLLSQITLVGKMKTRAMASWLDEQGFQTRIEERRFGRFSRRAPDEPAVAICGVDNQLARSYLEGAGFDWIIETGLGAGPAAFKNFSLHTFPSSLKATTLWADAQSTSVNEVLSMPAYNSHRHPSLDDCGLTQLASRTIGVPFVGLVAASFGIAEILRRLHGASGFEVISGSTVALEDIEMSPTPFSVYAYGHTHAVRPLSESMRCSYS